MYYIIYSLKYNLALFLLGLDRETDSFTVALGWPVQRTAGLASAAQVYFYILINHKEFYVAWFADNFSNTFNDADQRLTLFVARRCLKLKHEKFRDYLMVILGYDSNAKTPTRTLLMTLSV